MFNWANLVYRDQTLSLQEQIKQKDNQLELAHERLAQVSNKLETVLWQLTEAQAELNKHSKKS